ncbi:F-box domain-containing protein [Favolaschia claudopus]|uniref:F-box domain-containing protein n=1 Tax=Favolaschia claudopus TaxID=2862362 RepID=A0AAW0C322_9AGAR
MESIIQRLPVEILSEIFLHCREDHEGCRPRLVATICRGWRDVALSTSQLWSCIDLDEEEIREDSLCSLLELQLERSGQVPLSIVFCEPRNIVSTLQLLLAVTHRWHSVSLACPRPNQVELLRDSTHSFPILKRMDIRYVEELDLEKLFQPHPQLHELILRTQPGSISATFVEPWSKLSKCCLRGCLAVDALNILRLAPQLRELWVEYCYWAGGACSRTTSTLRSLTISNCSNKFKQNFLRNLVVPELQELVLDDFTDNNHIVPFLTACCPPLHRLSLTNVVLTEAELIAILRLVNTLAHLELSWPSDVHSSAFIEAMTIPSNTRRPRLLPDLRALSITGGLSCRNDVLLTMLQSRCPGLERVELYYAGRTFFFHTAFDQLRKDGMKIDVLLDGPIDPFAPMEGRRDVQ